MKKVILLFLLMLLAPPSLSIADNKETPKTTPVKRVPIGDPVSPREHRIPSQYITCTIDPLSGITITSVEKSEINGYELWDYTDNCLFSTCDEFEFIDYLYTLQGVYTLCIFSGDYIYTGVIEL